MVVVVVVGWLVVVLWVDGRWLVEKVVVAWTMEMAVVAS